MRGMMGIYYKFSSFLTYLNQRNALKRVLSNSFKRQEEYSAMKRGLSASITHRGNIVHDEADCSLESSQVPSSICQKFHLLSRIDGSNTLIK